MVVVLVTVCRVTSDFVAQYNRVCCENNDNSKVPFCFPECLFMHNLLLLVCRQSFKLSPLGQLLMNSCFPLSFSHSLSFSSGSISVWLLHTKMNLCICPPPLPPSLSLSLSLSSCTPSVAEILAISTAAEHLLESRKKMGNIAIFTDSLSTRQALNSADPDQMIQGLHSSLAKLTVQFTVSLQWVPAHVGLTGNEKADLQKSAVRLLRHRILSPTERPRHFSTLGTMETGRNKTVDIRHTFTQFGDWSGPSRPLSSACTQGIVVWVPIWRGLAFQTLPCVSADKLTKPQTTSFSLAQSMPRDVS